MASRTPSTVSPASLAPTRRRVLRTGVAAGAGALVALAAPGLVRAQARPRLRIGYWPVAAGLPFFAAVEKGYFREAGIDVEPLKFAGAQQVMEAMLAGRCDGSANGTGSANLAIGEIAQPGLFKIFCTNPSNAKFVLDEFIVAKDSPIKTMAELAGKKIASGPGIQNVTLCKTMLERAGAKGADLVLADTAGRLQNKTNLMEELKKIRRIADREPGKVTEVLLVIDGVTGQNGLSQAREFLAATDVTGVVLTKLDGSAMGGIVLAIQSELGLPVKVVGVGEGAADLVEFDPREFAAALFDS